MSSVFSIFAPRPCSACFPLDLRCTNIGVSYKNPVKWVGNRALRGTQGLYLKPKSLHEAVTVLAASGGQILSGGTDFYPGLGERLPKGDLVDISALAEIRGITIGKDWIRIGGLTTWTDVIRTSLPPSFDGLKAAAREVGSIQIQNRGTVAGNLCNASPAADGVPPLLALDAEIELASSLETRRMALDVFVNGARSTLLAPDEVMTAILTPLPASTTRSAFFKLGARRYLVISISMVAAVVLPDADGRVAEAR